MFLKYFRERNLIRIYVSFFALAFIISCTKKKGCKDIVSLQYDNEAEVDDGTCEYGGEGGLNTIVFSPHSQGRPVYNKTTYLDSVYVKFNAIEVPGIKSLSFGGDPNGYDRIFTGNVGDSTIIIPGLKKGKYVIYITGYDSLLQYSKRVAQIVNITLSHDSSQLNRYVVMWPICCVF